MENETVEILQWNMQRIKIVVALILVNLVSTCHAAPRSPIWRMILTLTVKTVLAKNYQNAHQQL